MDGTPQSAQSPGARASHTGFVRGTPAQPNPAQPGAHAGASALPATPSTGAQFSAQPATRMVVGSHMLSGDPDIDRTLRVELALKRNIRW